MISFWMEIIEWDLNRFPIYQRFFICMNFKMSWSNYPLVITIGFISLPGLEVADAVKVIYQVQNVLSFIAAFQS